MKQGQSARSGSIKDFQELLFRQTLDIDTLEDHDGRPLRQIVSYWRRNKLVPFLRDAKLLHISYAELIWLRILDTLRQFGCTIAQMEAVCDYFFKDAYYDDLPKKNLLNNKELLTKKKLAGTLDEKENNVLHAVEDHLKDEALLYSLKFKLNYLTDLIDRSICQNVDGGVYVFTNGDVAERIEDTISSHRSKQMDMKKPHIYISLVHYLSEIIDPEELSNISPSHGAHKSEHKVLQQLRNKALSQITVRLKEGEILAIDTVKSGQLTEIQSLKIKEILNLHNYETVTLHSRNQTSLSFTRTKKSAKKNID